MIVRILLLILILSFAFVQGCAKEENPQPEIACFFQQNNYKQRVSWKALPVILYADASMSDFNLAAVNKAIEIWNDSLREKIGGQTAFAFAERTEDYIGLREDRKNVISITEQWDRDPGEQAETLLIWKDTHIYDADIRINGLKPLSTTELVEDTQLDIVALIVHELGHVLGLAHIETTEYTTMAVSLGFGDGSHRRKVGALELDALKCEY